MPTSAYSVTPLDLQAAQDSVLSALTDHQNLMQAESHPDDPPRNLEVRRNGWRNMPAGSELRCWIVWDGDGRAIIANAWTEASTTADNYHLVYFNILVLPEYRRRGIGRHLLAAVTTYAESSRRGVLLTQTSGRLPAGAMWMQKIGATPSSESQISQLVLAELDANLLHAWIERALERNQDFELAFWEGSYPQADLDAMARLYEIQSTASRVTDTIQALHVTPEQLRQREQTSRARGDIRWTSYVREKATGNLAGFTEVSWNPQQPEVIEQGFTGVLPHYRNRGLGRWLKAAMLDKIRQERPHVHVVRTGNATSNVPMLRINDELGFRPYSPDLGWEVDVEQVQRYLAAHV